MNWLQKLLGLDKMVKALHETQQSNLEMRGMLEAIRQKELAKQQEEHTRQQLAAVSTNTAQDTERTTSLLNRIADLEQQLERAKQFQGDPQTALLQHFQEKMDEKKKGVGRPRIEGKRYEMRLDLDIAVILEEVARIQNKSLARLMNQIARDYLSASYGELFDALSAPKDPASQFDPFAK